MSPEIAVALIVAVIAPAVMSSITAYHTRVGKREDYARQDLVAERAEAVARQAAAAAELLLRRQNNIADRTDAVAAALLEADQRAAKAAKLNANQLAGKLDVIHTLVNSNLTAAMQSELDAIGRELVMMHEVISLKKTAGHEPSETTMAQIANTEERVEELTTQLAERRRQDEIANAQLVKIVAMEHPGDEPSEEGEE